MQSHIKSVIHYVENVEKKPELTKRIAKLPPVWVKKILIVDDEKMVSDLIKALLNREGDIDIAENGQDALELIDKQFYKLIISDIEMPVMDGFNLYEKAVAKFPKLDSRFLFMTGDVTAKKKEFFAENQVKYLAKPMEIKVL